MVISPNLLFIKTKMFMASRLTNFSEIWFPLCLPHRHQFRCTQCVHSTAPQGLTEFFGSIISAGAARIYWAIVSDLQRMWEITSFFVQLILWSNALLLCKLDLRYLSVIEYLQVEECCDGKMWLVGRNLTFSKTTFSCFRWCSLRDRDNRATVYWRIAITIADAALKWVPPVSRSKIRKG